MSDTTEATRRPGTSSGTKVSEVAKRAPDTAAVRMRPTASTP